MSAVAICDEIIAIDNEIQHEVIQHLPLSPSVTTTNKNMSDDDVTPQKVNVHFKDEILANQNDSPRECRICRSSDDELADNRRRSSIFSTSRRYTLHEVQCQCSGSLKHVCTQCYKAYYDKPKRTNCEICRHGIDINRSQLQIILKRICTAEVKACGYVIGIIVLFFVLFSFFFALGIAQSSLRKEKKDITSAVFIVIVTVNFLGILFYVLYSYKKSIAKKHQNTTQQIEEVATTAGNNVQINSMEIPQITVTIHPEPQQSHSESSRSATVSQSHQQEESLSSSVQVTNV